MLGLISVIKDIVLLWYPVLVPQITGAVPPSVVALNWALLHCVLDVVDAATSLNKTKKF